MAPRKTTGQRGDKRKFLSNSLFRSPQHYERYSHQFETTPIIQERHVNLADFKDSFIPSCFEGWGYDKLLGELPRVCETLIKEFYANASLKEDHTECWVRGCALRLYLDLKNKIMKGSFRSRIEWSLRIGGSREGRCLNTTSFPSDLRCLAYIMMFNLYSVRKLSTINNVRALFLMELREKIYIDIGAHLYNIIAKATKTISRAKLVLPSFIMRILHENGVETPRHISLMTLPSSKQC